MPWAGHTDFFVGDHEWHIGSWYLPASAVSGEGIEEQQRNLFIFRDDNNKVITSLVFEPLLPGEVAGPSFSIEWTGVTPIKIQGFYLRAIRPEQYTGLNNPQLDVRELIRWGDEYNPLGDPLGDLNLSPPGMEMTQFDVNPLVDDFVITQFKSGQGDSSITPIPYTGHENGILPLDERAFIDLRIRAPSDVDKEILQASRYNFAFDIVWFEIAPNIEEILLPQP